MKKKRIGWVPYCVSGPYKKGYWLDWTRTSKKKLKEAIFFSDAKFKILPVYVEVP